MPPRKCKTTAKATANATANATAKATAKATTTAAKAKATRARNKATAARIDRILQSSPPPTAGPTGPSGPSETIGSNSAAELAIARAGKAKEVEIVNRRHNHNPIPFAIKDYLDSRKPYIEHSLIIDFNSIIRPRWDFWQEYI
ncbi:hypothetical protein NA56DRAFT_410770 [Hyaloscypha hepaticicola]|uniref:Uncharacterized protein n=1 Tax=Hyaloscypha hepaticicola TaxID=2082293 RepID=A0A2J6PIR4_9HELO|nr:hypothetical protein NA56DRAFT_410770 [Hyaloscypha hepaticicola]